MQLDEAVVESSELPSISSSSSFGSLIMGLPSDDHGMVTPRDSLSHPGAAPSEEEHEPGSGLLSETDDLFLETTEAIATAEALANEIPTIDDSASAFLISSDDTANTQQQQEQQTAVAAAPPPSAAVVQQATAHQQNSIPEFLYQLTKMLTDDNREIIEWSKGRIEVHSPHKLESRVLSRYFRHSKFASFQRQLNYFGFRKQAGKGKMAPCSYINDATTDDLSSILTIKRKTGHTCTSKEKSSKRRDSATKSSKRDGKVGHHHAGVGMVGSTSASGGPVNPVLAGILYRSNTAVAAVAPGQLAPVAENRQRQALARTAVGRGIRHGFPGGGGVAPRPAAVAGPPLLLPGPPPLPPPPPPSVRPTAPGSSAAASAVAFQDHLDSLAALESNYRNSLNDLQGAERPQESKPPDQVSSLAPAANNTSETSDLLTGAEPTPLDQLKACDVTEADDDLDSLVNLAMIPTLEEDDAALVAQSPEHANDADNKATTAAVTATPDGPVSSSGAEASLVGINFVDFPDPSLRPKS